MQPNSPLPGMRNAYVLDANETRVELLDHDMEHRADVQPHELFESMDHVAVRSGDIDGAVRFYRDLLGLSTIQELPVQGSTSTMTYLGVKTDVIELLRTDQTEEPASPHLALRVKNVDDGVAALAERGIHPLPGYPADARSGLGRLAVYTDPDGVEISLLDRADLRAL
jgi:catechol 2,3-dioxygenase-like lactoylglutathione lyase family enzyme